MLLYCYFNPLEQLCIKLQSRFILFHWRKKRFWNCCLSLNVLRAVFQCSKNAKYTWPVDPFPLPTAKYLPEKANFHYCDVIMGTMTSQITSLTIVYSNVYADQRKHQSSASLAFVWGIGEFPAHMASNAENVSIWWRHHVLQLLEEKWHALSWCSTLGLNWCRQNGVPKYSFGRIFAKT